MKRLPEEPASEMRRPCSTPRLCTLTHIGNTDNKGSKDSEHWIINSRVQTNLLATGIQSDLHPGRLPALKTYGEDQGCHLDFSPDNELTVF